jgi:cytochrome c
MLFAIRPAGVTAMLLNRAHAVILALLSLCGLAACGGGESHAPLSEAAERGKVVFATHCALCHTNPGAFAPNLRGVVGRRVGTASFPYSVAMRNANFVWTKKNLERFLEAPRDVIPGNQMAFFGMPDAAMRSDLIEYLVFSSPAQP